VYKLKVNKNTGKILFVLVSGIVLGLITGMVLGLPEYDPTAADSREETLERVVETYRKANPGTQIEAMSIEEFSGLYRIRLSSGGDEGTYQTVYTTKDGKFLTEILTNITEFRTFTENRLSFIDCLEEEDVIVFGALGTENEEIRQATELQLQLLGGPEYLERVYIDCTEDLEWCAEQGVEVVPSVKHGEDIYGGVKTYEWFEEVVGCTI